MSTAARPGMHRRPGGPSQQSPQGRPWWHYALLLTALATLGGMAWGGYAIWFSLTHVRAIPAKVTGLVVSVAAKTDARVREVAVDTGDEVEKGQVVAQLENADVKAAVERAQAYLVAQESESKRAESELELTIRQTAASVREAEAELEAARARLAQAEAEKELERRQRPDEVRHAEAALASAQSQLNDAKATLGRMEKLFGQGAVSQQRLDAARTEYQVAQAEVEAAQAALAVARAKNQEAQIRQEYVATRAAEERQAIAGLESAHTTRRTVALREQEVLAKRAEVAQAEATLEAAEAVLADCVLRSPVNGVVVKGPSYPVREGEFVAAGQPVVTIFATDVPLWISAAVSELYVDRVREGQPALIRIDAFRRRWFDGEVEEVGRATELSGDQTSPWMMQRVPLKISFDPKGMDVRHGMTCRVWIDARER